MLVKISLTTDYLIYVYLVICSPKDLRALPLVFTESKNVISIGRKVWSTGVT